MKSLIRRNQSDRRNFIGGSDARIIMGNDEAGLLRLWREKRGRGRTRGFVGNLYSAAGVVTEDLNRRWYEANSGQVVTSTFNGKFATQPSAGWERPSMAASKAAGPIFEAKFMLPWSFSEEAAAAEIRAATAAQYVRRAGPIRAVLSMITGGGKWVEIKTHADPLYQHLIVTAERKFWRCVESGEPPRLFGIDPPKPRIEAVRIVDMSASNAWAEYATAFARTHPAFLEHERAKAELKSLVPEDAQQAIGHGVRAKRSKSGAITVELLEAEDSHAAV